MEEVYSLYQSKTSKTMAHYDLHIEFIRRKENIIANTLSEVCLLQSTHPKTIDSNIDVIPVHHITRSALVSKQDCRNLDLQHSLTQCSAVSPRLYIKADHSPGRTAQSNYWTSGVSGQKSVRKMVYSTKATD